MGTAVGKHLAARHPQFIHSTVLEPLIEIPIGILLNGKTFVLQEGIVLDEIAWLIKIDQDADAAALGGREYRA